MDEFGLDPRALLDRDVFAQVEKLRAESLALATKAAGLLTSQLLPNATRADVDRLMSEARPKDEEADTRDQRRTFERVEAMIEACVWAAACKSLGREDPLRWLRLLLALPPITKADAIEREPPFPHCPDESIFAAIEALGPMMILWPPTWEHWQGEPALRSIAETGHFAARIEAIIARRERDWWFAAKAVDLRKP